MIAFTCSQTELSSPVARDSHAFVRSVGVQRLYVGAAQTDKMIRLRCAPSSPAEAITSQVQPHQNIGLLSKSGRSNRTWYGFKGCHFS